MCRDNSGFIYAPQPRSPERRQTAPILRSGERGSVINPFMTLAERSAATSYRLGASTAPKLSSGCPEFLQKRDHSRRHVVRTSETDLFAHVYLPLLAPESIGVTRSPVRAKSVIFYRH